MTVPIQTLTRPEAARYLGVSEETLDKLRAFGEIAETWIGRQPGGKRGGVLRFRRSVLDRYLDRKTRSVRRRIS